MHVEAERAVVELRGADLHQLEQDRVQALPGGRVQPDHGLVDIGGELGPVQAGAVCSGAAARRSGGCGAFVVMASTLRAAMAQEYGPFP